MKIMRPKISIPQVKLVPIILSMLFGIGGCWCFSLRGSYLILLIPLGALTVLPGIRHVLKGRSDAMEQREFLRFIDFLSSRVSAGHHIEQAMGDAPRHIRQDLRSRSPLLRSLEKASRSLRSGLALHIALEQLAGELSSSSLRRFCQMLPEIVRQGAKTDLFLQNIRDQLRKSLETLEELRAEQSSVASECLIMSLMPFFMAAVGKAVPAFRASMQSRGQIVALLFCEAAFMLFTLCLYLSVFRVKDRPAESSKFLPRQPASWVRQSAKSILGLYPGDLGYRLRAVLQKLYPGDSLIWEKFCQLKILLTGSSVLLSLLLSLLSGKIFPLLLIPLPPLLLDLKIAQSGRESSEAERQQYPAFLNLMAILLSAGLSLDRSLRLTLRVLEENGSQKNNKKKISILGRDLRLAARQLRSGASAAQVLHFLGQRQSLSEISQVLHMMARYEREGGREQLSLIRMQALQSREIYRLSMRRRLSRRGLLYLLPMGLDLFLVIAVTAWPALRNLGSAL